VIAAAALDGEVTIESFSDEQASRPAFREMLGRVELREHPEWGIDHWRDQPVEVVLRGGTVLRDAVDAPRGTRKNALSHDEIVAKFTGCAERALSTRQTVDAIDAVWGLDHAHSVRGVVDTLIA
jgi:2-methylcitrate dehydratase PrpD